MALRGYITVDYRQALGIFNETVSNLNSATEAQRLNTISEINAIQAQSMDPADMEAYNMTMYGIDSIHDIKCNIMDTVGNVNNYDIYNNTTMGAYQVDPTAVPTTLTAGVASNSGGFFSPVITDPTSILPTNSPGQMLVFMTFMLLLGKFLILRR
mgnify:CR=1 FL=1